MKRTKIVCTIGPASEKPDILAKMIRAGMNVARLNLSHGDYRWHSRAIAAIREAAKKVGAPIAIMLDLQGPKARLGELGIKNQALSIGEKVVFTTAQGEIKKIPIAVPNFHKYVKVGAHLLIADGALECVVENVKGRDIQTRVILGGTLRSHKGIVIQGVSLPLPSLTVKDKRDAQWAAAQDIDFAALSFVKQASDVLALRRLLRRPELQIVVKIETREAVQNFEEILSEADGIMIARGDLALAISPEEVPLLQKEIIEKCRRAAVPVIVATEMLASMERAPRPTRAEASDVANAVIDHTDATMLSGESATGQFPVEAVAMMAHIIEKTEQSRFDDVSIGAEMRHGTTEEETALVVSVLARTVGAQAIVAGSLTGHMGRLLARFRTEVPLLVGSPTLRVVRQLNLSWGVRPFLMLKVKSVDKLFRAFLDHIGKSNFKRGSKIVFVGSEKISPHASSFVGLHRL